MKCIGCGEVEVGEPEYCCNGRECGCMGLPIDPPLCDECYEKEMNQHREALKNFHSKGQGEE